MTTLAISRWAAFDDTLERFAVLTPDNRLRVFDAASGHLKLECYEPGHLAAAYSCFAWGSKASALGARRDRKVRRTNLPLVAIGTKAGIIVIWDISKGEVMKKLGTVETNILAAKQPSTPQQNSGHTGPVNAVAFCEHTGSLLSCGSDGLLIQWDPTTGEIIKKYVADSDPVNSVAPFPDEQAIATGGVTIKLWDTVSGRCQKKFTGHPSPATQLVASKAQHIAADRFMYAWDCDPMSRLLIPLQCFSADFPPLRIGLTPIVTEEKRLYAVLSQSAHQVDVWVWDPSLSYQLAVAGNPQNPLLPHCRITSPDTRILCASFSGHDSIVFARGSHLRIWFDSVKFMDSRTYTVSQAIITLSDIDKDQLLLNEKFHSITPAIPKSDFQLDVVSPARASAIKSAKGPSSVMTLEQHVQALHDDFDSQPTEKHLEIPENPDPEHTVSAGIKAGSLQSVLVQALNTNDKKLLESCIYTSEEDVIQRTIKRLPTAYVIPFLKSAVEKLETDPSHTLTLVLWIVAVLNEHASYLMSVPQVSSLLSDLYLTISSRVSSHKKLLRILGRLNLLLSQVGKVRPPEKQGPQVIYTEDAELVYTEDAEPMEEDDTEDGFIQLEPPDESAISDIPDNEKHVKANIEPDDDEYEK